MKNQNKPTLNLNKYLASIGIGSRRYCEQLIKDGEVEVNNNIAHIGMKVDPYKDKILLHNRQIIASPIPNMHYLILYKPCGYLTTMADPLGRPTIKNLIPKIEGRIYPVGRLDFHSEGLILLTNDGNLAYKLTHPSFMVSKTYMVKVKGRPKQSQIGILKKGIKLEDGWAYLDSILLKKSSSKRNTWFELSIHEGRNRLIRRMFKKIGHPVLKLKRICFAGIKLGTLKPGEWRYFTQKEVNMLKTRFRSITKNRNNSKSR